MTGRQLHIACEPGDIAPAVLLPGDPGRVARMATQLDGVREVAASREFTTVTGTTAGVPVTITSTGVGAPSTSIAVEELWNLGARLFIRVGTCGGIQDATRSGDLVIATGAVRGDGTSPEYIDLSYPAVADPDVTVALRGAAVERGETPHVGVVRTHDAFYVESLLARGDFRRRVQPWRDAGVLAIENEAAALFVIATLRGARAGAICAVAGELYGMEPGDPPPSRPERVDVATAVALAAVRRLAG
jgi:uridine phosphorylase